MGMVAPRPERKKIEIPSTDSPPCAECANCKPDYQAGSDNGSVLSGRCYAPDNQQDSKGTIGEPIEDIEAVAGHCRSYSLRATRWA